MAEINLKGRHFLKLLDYTPEEIAKLEAFISDETMASSRTLYFTAYPTQSWDSMPNLKNFLNEWGLNPTVGVIQESDSSRFMSTGNGQAVYVFADVNTDMFTGDFSMFLDYTPTLYKKTIHIGKYAYRKSLFFL